MQFQHINLTYWPVALYVAPTQVNDEHMRAVMDEMQQMRTNRFEHAVVMDLTLSPPLTLDQRRMITERGPETDALVRMYCRGMALVFTSLALKVTLNAILMLRATPCPHRVFNDRFEALRWARAQMGDVAKVSAVR